MRLFEGSYVRVLFGLRIGQVGQIQEAKPGCRLLVGFDSGKRYYYEYDEVEPVLVRVMSPVKP